MLQQIEYYGPVGIYVREENGEWIAWADPFSECGIGETKEEAIQSAQRSVEDYLALVSRELCVGKTVKFLTPLTKEEKTGAEALHFHLFVCHEISEAAPVVPVERKSKPLEGLLALLEERHRVFAGPIEAGDARACVA